MSDRSSQALAEPHMGVTWDYEVASIHARHNELLEDQLKDRGRQGWELVCVHMPMANEYQCIFRRPMNG